MPIHLVFVTQTAHYKARRQIGQDAVRCVREHLYAAYKRTRVDHHMYAFRPSLLFFIEDSYYSSQHTSKRISSVLAPSSQLTPIRTRSSLGVRGRTFSTMSILGIIVKHKLSGRWHQLSVDAHCYSRGRSLYGVCLTQLLPASLLRTAHCS
jgi:hypothetical protein